MQCMKTNSLALFKNFKRLYNILYGVLKNFKNTHHLLHFILNRYKKKKEEKVKSQTLNLEVIIMYGKRIIISSILFSTYTS
jgi:hypothetical protein